jgi:hypothetical protein
MWPLTGPLQAGVRRVPQDALQPGDVIAFLADRAPELWIHRVVRVSGDCVVTRGDTNGYDDAPVPCTAILGRVDALRVGSLTIPLWSGGLGGSVARRVGIAWSHIAPALRRGYARQKSAAKGR